MKNSKITVQKFCTNLDFIQNYTKDLFLILILVFFILAFAVKNIKTYLATKESIRGKSTKLSMSILLSTLIYVLILLRLTFLDPKCLLEINLSAFPVLNLIGLFLVSMGFILGLLALNAMKNSWRVGIKYDQKTALVSTGIYRFSRNPYFLSYNILILGYLLLFPSIILFAFYLALVITFHSMILEEEAYLLSVHGEEYSSYKKKVSRYITLK